MATVGEATIKLAFDGKSLKASAEKEAPQINSTLSKIGGAAKITGKTIALGLTAGFQVTKGVIEGVAGAAIKSYGEFEQLAGGIDTLYGRSADVMMKNAQNAYKTAGMSANEYMQTATSFAGSLVQSLGGNTAKAAKYADRAIQDMSDNANKMGTDIGMIQNAYQGFAKQNFTMLDNLKLGYGGTKGEMERLLEDAEKLSGKKFDISSYADITEAIHIIQKQMKITGTTAEEAGTTIQGSFGMAKAALHNLATGLVDPNADIGKLVDNMITSIFGDGTTKNKGLLGNILPALQRAITGIAKALPKLIKELVSNLTPLLKEIIPPLMEATTQVFVAIVQALPTIAPLLADGLAQMLVTLIPYLPTILGAFFNAIFTFVGAFFGKIGEYIGPWLAETLGGMATAIGNWFREIGIAISTFLGDFAQAAVEKIATFAQGFWQAIQNIKNWFASIPAFFAGIIGKIGEKVRQFGAKVGDIVGGAFKAVVNGVLGFIENFINTPIRAINGLIDTINNVPGIDLGRLDEFHLPRLAKGGLATGSTLANIGEAGAEAVIPLERNPDSWAAPLARAIADQFTEQGIGGAGITVYMTNNINNNLDADEIGQRLMTSIRRAA